MVAREQRALAGQREGQMIHRVTRRGDRLQRESLALVAVALGEDAIGRVRRVPAGCGFALHRRAKGTVRTAAEDRRARALLEEARAGRMIVVGVSHQDGLHALAGQRGEQGVDMRRQRRAGIDDGHPAVPHHVGVRALEGHGAGVGRHDPAHERGQHVHRARCLIEDGVDRHRSACPASAQRGSPRSASRSCSGGGSTGRNGFDRAW